MSVVELQSQAAFPYGFNANTVPEFDRPPAPVVPYSVPFPPTTTRAEGLEPLAPPPKLKSIFSVQASPLIAGGDSENTVPQPSTQAPGPPALVVPYNTPPLPIDTLAAGYTPSLPPANSCTTLSVHVPPITVGAVSANTVPQPVAAQLPLPP
jgi:hypothetical protein